MCLVYTLSCFTMFRPKNKKRRNDLLDNQVIYMFIFLFLCNAVLFLKTFELKILIFFAAQVVFFEVLMIVFPKIYKKASRLLINNTCFLLGVGFVILTRLSFDLALRQFAIAAIGVTITSVIPSGINLDGFTLLQVLHCLLQFLLLVFKKMDLITGLELEVLLFSHLNL